MRTQIETGYLTNHASMRMQQRGIRHQDVAAVFVHGDQTKAVGGSAVAISLTRHAAAELAADGHFPSGVAARLTKLTLIADEEKGTVITVLWRHGQNGRRYTRGTTVH